MRRRATWTRWRTLSALVLAMALAVAACAPQSESTTTSSAATGDTEVGVDLGDTLNIATWPNYDDPETIKKFTAETGVNVNISVFGSTEEMEALLRAGSSGFDLVVPTHYAVPGWISDGLIEPLDYAKLGNPDLAAWNPLFINQSFDPGNRYTIPKNWGTTGIIYSPASGEPVTSWSEFFDRAKGDLDGRAVIVDHQISTIGSAAVAMGYDLNTTVPDELAKIEAMLVDLKPYLWAITSDVQPALRGGDSWASMAWTGDGVQVERDNPDFTYVIPEDGGELWVDNWTVAANAPNREAAYAFLKFMLRPENSAEYTAFILFPSADPAVLPFLPEEIANNKVIYPDQEAISRMTLSSADAYNSEARAEMWARVKASS